MTYALALITAPASEPVTLAEAKLHLRVDVTDEDAMITLMIQSARLQAEHLMRRSLLTQTWELTLDRFPVATEGGPGLIKLPRSPVQSVTTIKYIDTAGTEQTLANTAYKIDIVSEPAQIASAFSIPWPIPRYEIGALKIRYVCGYASASAVPATIKGWILLTVGWLFENREAFFVGQDIRVIPARFIDGLLDPYRIREMY